MGEAQDGKQRLVAALASTHEQQLHRFLRRRVRNAADVPDLVQEVYLRLLRVPNHESIRTPEAYIFTVAKHVAQQHSLHRAAEQGTVFDEMTPEVAYEVDPSMEVTGQQCLEEIDRTLEQMSPKVQLTFLLSRRDGMSVDEISAHLGISRPMVKKYMVKALVLFRKRLKDLP